MFEIELFLHLTECRQRKAILILNWIVWKRTVYMYKNGFGIKKPIMVDMSLKLNQIKSNQPNNFHVTENQQGRRTMYLWQMYFDTGF